MKYNGGKGMRAHVLDVSSEGLCLQLEHGSGLLPNQAVHVRLEGGDWVLAMVAHVDVMHVGLWFGDPISTEAAGLVNRVAELMH